VAAYRIIKDKSEEYCCHNCGPSRHRHAGHLYLWVKSAFLINRLNNIVGNLPLWINFATQIAFLTHISSRTYVSDAVPVPIRGHNRSIAAKDVKPQCRIAAITEALLPKISNLRHMIPKLRDPEMRSCQPQMPCQCRFAAITEALLPKISNLRCAAKHIPSGSYESYKFSSTKGPQAYPGMPPATRRSARQPDEDEEQAAPAPPDPRARTTGRRQTVQEERRTEPPAATTARTREASAQCLNSDSAPGTSQCWNQLTEDRPVIYASSKYRFNSDRSDWPAASDSNSHRLLAGPSPILLQSTASIQSNPTGTGVLPPMTPARRVADRLTGLLTHQTAMASPGPRMHNTGPQDSESEDEYNPPIISPGRPADRIPAPLFDPDSDEDIPPSQPAPTTTSHPPAARAAAPRQRRHAATVAAVITDADGFKWTTTEDLVPTDKAADCNYFYGQHY
ncbi:hypothetical protein DFH09DRAFT_1118677, partial [Mycena vulgaris]